MFDEKRPHSTFGCSRRSFQNEVRESDVVSGEQRWHGSLSSSVLSNSKMLMLSTIASPGFVSLKGARPEVMPTVPTARLSDRPLEDPTHCMKHLSTSCLLSPVKIMPDPDVDRLDCSNITVSPEQQWPASPTKNYFRLCSNREQCRVTDFGHGDRLEVMPVSPQASIVGPLQFGPNDLVSMSSGCKLRNGQVGSHGFTFTADRIIPERDTHFGCTRPRTRSRLHQQREHEDEVSGQKQYPGDVRSSFGRQPQSTRESAPFHSFGTRGADGEVLPILQQVNDLGPAQFLFGTIGISATTSASASSAFGGKSSRFDKKPGMDHQRDHDDEWRPSTSKLGSSAKLMVDRLHSSSSTPSLREWMMQEEKKVSLFSESKRKECVKKGIVVVGDDCEVIEGRTIAASSLLRPDSVSEWLMLQGLPRSRAACSPDMRKTKRSQRHSDVKSAAR